MCQLFLHQERIIQRHPIREKPVNILAIEEVKGMALDIFNLIICDVVGYWFVGLFHDFILAPCDRFISKTFVKELCKGACVVWLIE